MSCCFGEGFMLGVLLFYLFIFVVESSSPACYKRSDISEAVYESLLPGFAPVTSWRSLSYGSAPSSRTYINDIRKHLAPSALRVLISLSKIRDYDSPPDDPDSCRLACMLHPNCNSFFFSNATIPSIPFRSVPRGCHLTRATFEKDGTEGAPVTAGPRFCSGEESLDFDGDGVLNKDDGCPLHVGQQDRTCPCFLSSSAPYKMDALCKWTLTSNDCIVPLVDPVDGRAKLLETVGSGFSGDSAFEMARSPEKCHQFCQKNSRCDFFVYSFTRGCHLYQAEDASAVNFLMRGTPRLGLAAGPAFCEDLPAPSFTPAGPQCRRDGVALTGITVTRRPIQLGLYTDCVTLCKVTPQCQAWSYVFDHGDSSSEGECSLIFIIVGENRRKATFSSSKEDCGSCYIDSDGDGVYDCEDYCPNDPEKIYPGLCGCGRGGTPPQCREARLRRLSGHVRLLSAEHPVRLPDDVAAKCYSNNLEYITSDGLRAVRNCSPVLGWLGPGGEIVDTSRTSRVGQDCHIQCQVHPNCTHWSFSFAGDGGSRVGCFLFDGRNATEPLKTRKGRLLVSGPKFCPGSCHDGVLNQDEDMIDCGGATCAPCGSLCNDGLLNQDELDVDCGGVCKQCECSANNGGCDQLCITFDDAPGCYCKPGYEMKESSTGRMSCHSVDLCKEGVPSPCVPFHCHNTQVPSPGFECSCPEDWHWTPRDAFCQPPVAGPCFTEETAVLNTQQFDPLLSPISEISGTTVPDNATECYMACLSHPDCFVWLYIVKADAKASDPFPLPGCHLRTIVKGVYSVPKAGVTSGFKFGDPEEPSCKRGVPGTERNPTVLLGNWSGIELDMLDMVFYGGVLEPGSWLIFFWGLPPPSEMVKQQIEKTILIASLEGEEWQGPDIERLNLDLKWELPTGIMQHPFIRSHALASETPPNPVTSASFAAQRLSVLETGLLGSSPGSRNHKQPLARIGAPVLTEELAGCTVTKDPASSNFCILKRGGLPANTTIRFEGVLCSGDSCGPPTAKFYRTKPLPPPPVKLNFTITRTGQGYRGQLQWLADQSSQYLDEAKSLSALITSLEVLASRASNIWNKTSDSPNLWLRVAGDSGHSAWEVINSATRKDLAAMLHSSKGAEPPFRFTSTSKCQGAPPSIEALMVLFSSRPRCIRSVQVEWFDFSSPQMTSMEVQTSQQWVVPDTLTNFTQHRCTADRVDSFYLVQSGTESPPLKGLRLYFGQPCSKSSSLPNSSDGCPSPFFALRSLRLEECGDAIQRWILVGRRMQDDPASGKRRRLQQEDSLSTSTIVATPTQETRSASELITDWTWDIAFTNERGPLFFRVNTAPSIFRNWISATPDITVDFSSIIDDPDDAEAWKTILWPVLVGCLAALSLLGVGLWCLIRRHRANLAKRRLERKREKEFAGKIVRELIKKKQTETVLQNADAEAPVVSPGGHFHSILEAISRILPTISEEPSFLEMTSERRSASRSWKPWESTPQRLDGPSPPPPVPTRIPPAPPSDKYITSSYFKDPGPPVSKVTLTSPTRRRVNKESPN